MLFQVNRNGRKPYDTSYYWCVATAYRFCTSETLSLSQCTFNRWRTAASRTWKYDDPRLKMSHEGAISTSHERLCVICLSHGQPHERTHARARLFNGPLSGTTRVNRYQKGKTNLDFTEARDSKWQWHQLGRMQVCTSLQTDNHASTPPLSFLQAGCPSCRMVNH